MPYLYESHMGGYFEDEDFLDYGELYCEECGDSDSLVGYFETEKELEELTKGREETHDKCI